ncbi:MAG: acetylglutamate kinase [Planctomycetia bacterium]|nr:acetylglutamate kinase [Planctomycetia bacterium]
MSSSPVISKVQQKAIQKADTLIEALGWIRKFRDTTTVIKLGGSVVEHPDSLRHLLLDIVFMSTLGMRVVIVHGGGKAISRAMDQVGIEPRFVQGRRYTDQATLDIVEKVLATELNHDLTAKIEEYGGRAMSLNFLSTNVLFGEKLTLEGPDGQPLDLGHVGEVTRVDRLTIDNLTYAGQVPVIPSMAITADGEKLNVNADTAATAVAAAIGAEKLVVLSDIPGVLRDVSDPESLIHSLTATDARRLINDGTISSGMIPKIEGCLTTLEQGVKKIHIIDGRLRHSLLLEIYTTSGVGTELVRDDAINLSARGAPAGAAAGR